MKKKVLFVIAQDPTYNSTDLVRKFGGLKKKKHLEPFYDGQLLDEYLERKRREQTREELSFNWYPQNAPGRWLAENIQVPSLVVEPPITLERLEKELEKDSYTHVVISIYLSGYSLFKNLSRFLRASDPSIKIGATSVGALLPETERYADFVLKGMMADDLRTILGKDKDQPYKVVVVPSQTTTVFKGITKQRTYGLLLTSFGCPYGCDFCPSTAQYGHRYLSPFSAQEIKEAIVKAREKLAPGEEVFTLTLAEPQGLGDIPLWKEVFKKCRDLDFQCELVSTTSSKVIGQYDLDELTKGSLVLSAVNVGVESLLEGQVKNKDVDLKRLCGVLQSVGINVTLTYIVGFDWQNRQNVYQEVKLLKDLDASGYIVANLEMQPGTPFYQRYKKEGRLLNVPPELLSFCGYQAFTHPCFASGFRDMLPLLEDLDQILESRSGLLIGHLDQFLKRRTKKDHPQRELFSSLVKTLDKDRLTQEYFRSAFRQVDLYHPYILSTN